MRAESGLDVGRAVQGAACEACREAASADLDGELPAAERAGLEAQAVLG